MNNKIAVLLGGNSSEREISIKSGYSILKSLIKSGLSAYPIDVRDFPIIHLKKQNFKKAYIALHGKGGEDGSIQGVLEYLNIPYTGSGIMASSISINKLQTKLLWKSVNLPIGPYIYLQKKEIKEFLYPTIIKKILKLKFPILVKPNSQGSSIGITLVYHSKNIKKALKHAFFYDDNVLIETFLKGKEYTVSILNNKILPTIQISTKNFFYDYNAKYFSSSTQYICPSKLEINKEKELKQLAMKAWKTIGCSGCGRIDVILDEKNQFWLLEVNTIPGMTDQSLVPISAKKYGISFDDLVLNILNINNKFE
ncbi:D-alanine--D-alanine ligase [Buchnera aphidicola (Muscaphis stroyani)]|uniref:D-alanine--D-alanine ligase n=1 Tax=Buchnera aphidicola (Muscaphis stroyani) TaxID=1241869 RepID=A0A4D6Y4E9_9GAMM|nr:D-alanine--D-alanine ligase [Buchnera aphidicola]QCI24302.1 D-alanine--D-alanine ligase [Buchnera aphidicola (Muscaphis stroyani)]